MDTSEEPQLQQPLAGSPSSAANGSSARSGPPPIPHIETNILKFSLIVQSYLRHAFHEFSHLIETFSSLSQTDMQKKKRFLQYIVQTRQDLIKLYVLCKWAAHAKHVSVNIDLLGWLRGQQTCYENLIWSLKQISAQLVSAKLPNPDILTALEVLRLHRPQLPSHGYLPQKPVAPQTIQQILRDLNMLLAIKLSLLNTRSAPDPAQQLPPEFAAYTIADGRVTFCVPHEFAVDLSIAGEDPQAPFFLVDFRLLHEGAHALTPLEKYKLERVTNDLLARNPLPQLYYPLHRLAMLYQLFRLHRQLIELRRGLWEGSIAHLFNPEKCLIIIEYWRQRKGPRNYIAIGLASASTAKATGSPFAIQWFRNGELVPDSPLTLRRDALDGQQLLETAAKAHAKWEMTNLYTTLLAVLHPHAIAAHTGRAVPSGVSIVHTDGPSSSPADERSHMVVLLPQHELFLRVGHARTLTLAIDPFTGRFAIHSPTPRMLILLQQMNELPATAATCLLQLRLISLQEELTTMLAALGLVRDTAITLSSEELRRNFAAELSVTAAEAGAGRGTALQKVTVLAQLRGFLFFRRRRWPHSWFLVASVAAYRENPLQWYMCSMICRGGLWRVQYLDEIRLGPRAELDIERFSYTELERFVVFAERRLGIELVFRDFARMGLRFRVVLADTVASVLTEGSKSKEPVTGTKIEGAVLETDVAQIAPGTPMLLLDLRTISTEATTWAHKSIYVMLVFPGGSSGASLFDGSTAVIKGKVKESVSSTFTGLLENLTGDNQLLVRSIDDDVVLNLQTWEFTIKAAIEFAPSAKMGAVPSDGFPVQLQYLPVKRQKSGEDGKAQHTLSEPDTLIKLLQQRLTQLEKVLGFVKLIKRKGLVLSEIFLDKISFRYGAFGPHAEPKELVTVLFQSGTSGAECKGKPMGKSNSQLLRESIAGGKSDRKVKEILQNVDKERPVSRSAGGWNEFSGSEVIIQLEDSNPQKPMTAVFQSIASTYGFGSALGMMRISYELVTALHQVTNSVKGQVGESAIQNRPQILSHWTWHTAEKFMLHYRMMESSEPGMVPQRIGFSIRIQVKSSYRVMFVIREEKSFEPAERLQQVQAFRSGLKLNTLMSGEGLAEVMTTCMAERRGLIIPFEDAIACDLGCISRLIPVFDSLIMDRLSNVAVKTES